MIVLKTFLMLILLLFDIFIFIAWVIENKRVCVRMRESLGFSEER